MGLCTDFFFFIQLYVRMLSSRVKHSAVLTMHVAVIVMLQGLQKVRFQLLRCVSSGQTDRSRSVPKQFV